MCSLSYVAFLKKFSFVSADDTDMIGCVGGLRSFLAGFMGAWGTLYQKTERSEEDGALLKGCVLRWAERPLLNARCCDVVGVHSISSGSGPLTAAEKSRAADLEELGN